MSAPLQNHSRNGSIDSKEHPLGSWSSGRIPKGKDNLPCGLLVGGLDASSVSRRASGLGVSPSLFVAGMSLCVETRFPNPGLPIVGVVFRLHHIQG